MGVAGAGKTTVGRAVAARLGWAFEDADDFHDAEAVAQMRRGEALSERQRAAWLARLGERLRRAHIRRAPLVLACSALRERHREALREAHPRVFFAWLDAPPALLHDRLSRRRGHFAGPDLLPSQLATLEPPAGALRLPASEPVEALASRVAAALERQLASREGSGLGGPL